MSLADALSIVANISVVVGILIGVIQLRHLARERQEEMVLRAFGPFLDPEFSRAFWTVMGWRYSSYEEFEQRATVEDLVTLDVVAMQFEMMGLLYHRGLASIELLDDLVAEPAIMVWNQIAPIIYGYRAKHIAPDWSRWHEELAVAIDERLTALGEPHAPLVRPAS